MAYLSVMDPSTAFIDPDAAKEKGKELTAAYQSGDPFPSIMIDDFLPDALAQGMLEHFGTTRGGDLNDAYDRAQERRKASFHPDTLDDYARSVFYAFNSRPFIKVLENITGIKGLIPDPYFMGGGFHEIRNGGHLSVHADFNHHLSMNLERRVNVLIYLNKDWSEDYGGQLELWDADMTRLAHSFVPSFNRCVIFNTTSDSMHGNPREVSHPDGISRKSIALYYYTATWDGLKRSHTTQFQVRPGTADRRDWSVKMKELSGDLLPPLLGRAFRRLNRTFRR